MRRREFIMLLGGAATWPLFARAQQSAVPMIGLLVAGSPGSSAQVAAPAFRKGLAEVGYIEGSSVAIEYRYAEGQYDRLPAMATELVNRQVAVIVASPTPAALAAKSATATLPIVFSVPDDPVELGLVASFSRPGGNATGVGFLLSELGPKQMGLLRELVPSARRFGLLVNPANKNAEVITRPKSSSCQPRGRGRHRSGERQPRDRGCLCDACAQQGRRAHRRHRPILLHAASPARHASGAPCVTHSLQRARPVA